MHAWLWHAAWFGKLPSELQTTVATSIDNVREVYLVTTISISVSISSFPFLVSHFLVPSFSTTHRPCRPRAYHACAHAQILRRYTGKDGHNADASASLLRFLSRDCFVFVHNELYYMP